jgi:hypothetical protein
VEIELHGECLYGVGLVCKSGDMVGWKTNIRTSIDPIINVLPVAVPFYEMIIRRSNI